MTFQTIKCPDCGANKWKKEDDIYHCPYCGCKFTDDSASRAYEQLVENINKQFGNAIDEFLRKEKEERFYALRTKLWEKVHAEYTDSAAIVHICQEIKGIVPSDFVANFYEIANGAPMKELVRFITKIDVVKQSLFVERLIDFLLKSLTSELIAPVNYLIEKAYRNTDLHKYEEYISRLEKEASKVDKGVYETFLPRDVFVAYASEDVEEVLELVEELEENGFSCFVALRNLQHGRGAVDNYQEEIYTAIDSCQMVVFISSKYSRSPKRDALRLELPYIKKKDLENAPAGYKLNYQALPMSYKKPRVEYRLDNEKTLAADMFLKPFFAGLDYCESKEKVLERVVWYLLDQSFGVGVVPTVVSVPISASVLAPVQQTITLAPKKQMVESKPRVAQSRTNDSTNGHSVGLIYSLNSDGRSYTVTGMGTCKDTQLVIPSTHQGLPVTRIDKETFSGCKNIVSISIPSNVKSIGKAAFVGCNNLTNLYITDMASWCNITFEGIFANPLGWAKNLYLNDNLVTELIIPKTVTEIQNGTFQWCTSLTKVLIHEGVEKISLFAFNYCFGLENIKVNKDNRHYIDIDGNLYNKEGTTLIQYARGKTATEFIIPDGVTSIGDYAFRDCENLTNVVIPDSVTSIGDYAFAGCKNLTNVVIPDGVMSIGEAVFCGCSNLTSVEIGDGTRFISGSMFESCSSLACVVIPNSVTSIRMYAFVGCKNLITVYYKGTKREWRKINIDEGNDSLTNATRHYDAPM